MLDVVIRGGSVIDGSGSARRTADVGIRDGRIVTLGRSDERARREIDADGLVVTPGFVDVHTHYDVQVFWDPLLTPSILHGVTTVFAGNCGFTVAPLRPETAEYTMQLLARVEGMPLEALEAGVPWDWQSSADYLARIEGNVAPNIGLLVGHSAIRRVAMGEDATRRTAEPEELDAMRALLRESLAAGALGFSSSWGGAHRDAVGDPVPSRWADADELVALAAVCGEFPGTSLEFIPDTIAGEFHRGIPVMARMSGAARRPLNWNVIRISAEDRDAAFATLEGSTLARALGGKVVALTMPVMPEPRISFRTGFSVDAIPGWGKAMTLPLADKVALLTDRAERRRLEELSTGADPRLADWPRRMILETFTPETKRYESRAVGDIAAEEGKSAFDALVDIALADGLRTTFTPINAADTPADWDARLEFWRDERTLIGGSDAGAHLDFLATFNLHTWFIDRIVRREGLMELEEAVHHFSGAPAQLYGLRDRGLLREGAYADVLVLDEQTVASGPVHMRSDLPAGAERLYAEAIGVEHVLVNGEPVVAANEPTGALPGTVLRAGRDTSTPVLAG